MCLFPIKAWRPVNLDTGALELSFKFVKGAEEISLPCGRCVECLRSYSTEWAVRCTLEASLYKSNCMITLTYAQSDGSVHKRDLQLFIKRLRKALAPQKIRYFACGEYGKKGRRPHYHIIVFGWRPLDCVRFFFRDDHWVYRSADVARIWSDGKDWSEVPREAGFITVEDVTFQSCLYTAKYLQKLSPLLVEQNPPFTLMSLKPGIGLDAFRPQLMETDKVYLNGKSYAVPRYFRRKYASLDIHSEERKLRGRLLNASVSDRRKSLKARFGVLRF